MDLLTISRTPVVSFSDFREAKILAPQGAMPLALLPRAARRGLDRDRHKLARRSRQRQALGASTSDIDHRITLNPQSITWTNGQGVHVTYAQVAGEKN